MKESVLRFEDKTTQGLPTLKLPASTKTILGLTR